MVATPPSTLLPPGQTTLNLTLSTSQATACRWDTAPLPYSQMAHTFTPLAAPLQQCTTLTGLSGGLTPSLFYVQCAAFSASPPLSLAYRSLPDSGSAPFPRLGNLWGSQNFLGHPEGLAYAASRSSLWLGSSWNASEIAQLRALNPYTIVLTSINACETNDQTLPDDYYLTNITSPPSTLGRLQSWPGAWRLDLLNPAVQAYQAALMYCLVLYGGSGYGPHPSCTGAATPPLIYDGLFIDNVFMDDGAAVNSQDIFHNPFTPTDPATGLPYTNFNARWKEGMVAMIALFRASMPAALLDGHAMDITDSNIAQQFNAISLGFIAPQMVEQRQTFASGLALYTAWMTQPARSPRITMVESAVRLLFGYGFGFDDDLETEVSSACANSHSVPGAPMPGIGSACQPTAPLKPGYMSPQTFLFARSEYQYMRFGLGFTLMGDGFFTHELGDSWHGQDWDYEELHFNLGLPTGGPELAPVLDPHPPTPPASIPLTLNWSLYVRDPATANASWALDAATVPPALPHAPPSARIDIAGTAPSADGIDLSQLLAGGLQSGGYALAFYAKASAPGTPLQLNARRNGGDWHNEGLSTSLTLSSQWQLYNLSFVGQADASNASTRLSWFAGAAAPNTSIWVNSPSLTGVPLLPQVLLRQFECGAVLLNGDTVQRTALLGSVAPGLVRLAGQQAPAWQGLVDDGNSAAFHPQGSAWAVASFESGYHGNSTPTQEEVRPPAGFYHHWEQGAHAAEAGGSGVSAVFDLGVPVPGLYNVSVWWPAAVPARRGWASAMQLTLSQSSAAPAVSVDLTQQGGDEFFPVFQGVQLQPDSTLTVHCPGGGGVCIADAVLVESAARWNDGSQAVNVTLRGMDAIVLRKTQGVPAHCAGA